MSECPGRDSIGPSPHENSSGTAADMTWSCQERERERERGEIARNLAVMGQIYYTSNVINFFRARRLCGLVPSLYGIPQACQTKNGGKPEEGRNVVFREAEAKHLVRTQVVQQSMVARAGS